MKNIYLNLFVAACFAMVSLNTFSQWTTIATDVTGDGSVASLLDGTELEFRYDSTNDSLWFRISTSTINSNQSMDLGFNIMVNYAGGGSTFNFWGSNNLNPYHKLVTGWVVGLPPSNYFGTIGIGDATGVSTTNYTNLFSDNLAIIVNTSASTIEIGMKRLDLIPNSAMGQPILTAAAVGASNSWNDDIYSASGIMTLPTMNVPVTTITVNGQGGINTIPSSSGSLQMTATVLPTNATDNTVSWSVVNGSGTATINAAGLLTASASGSVTVLATASDGSGVTRSQQISIGSANIQAFDKFEFDLFPNPTRSKIYFSIPNNEIVQKIVITDISGKTIEETNNLNFFDAGNLENGVYLLTVMSNENSILAIKKFQRQ